MTVQVPTSPNVGLCITWKKSKQAKRALKLTKKTSINFISPDLWPRIALTSVRSLTMFAVSCSSESIGRCLGMSMNTGSDWLKSGAALSNISNIFCKQLDNWINCQPK